MSIQIVTDTTSDIPAAVLETLPITVIPLYIALNGKSYRDNIDLTRKEFYEALPTASPHPTTAAPSPAQYEQVYDQLADQGATTIFSIHISKSLSAVYQSAESAAAQYARIPVIPIDSGNLTMAEGFVVIKAAQAAAEGKSVEEVQQVIDEVIPCAHAFAKLDTIDYLLKGGRMSAIQYNVVSLLGIKPILKMNNHTSRMEIARTKSKAFEKVLHVAMEKYPRAELFGITHANASQQVNILLQKLSEAYPDLPEPLVSGVTPSLGAHVGPGAVCINYLESPHSAEPEKKGFSKWLPK
jgi:DegV family protein with EDD domain